MEQQGHEEPQWRLVDKTIPTWQVYVGATVLTPVLGVACVLPYLLIWGRGLEVTNALGCGGLLLALLVGMPVHELLHAAGYLLAGAKASDIKIGFQPRTLLAYAHCKVPLRAAGYRFSIWLPTLVLGFVPVILGTVFHLASAVLFGTLMAACGSGDLLIIGKLLSVRRDALVRDHPVAVGFQLVERHAWETDSSLRSE